MLEDEGKELGRATELLANQNKTDENNQELNTWWSAAKESASKDKSLVTDAGLYGGRQALRLTSLVPLTMAVLYLLLILYFKSKGGYKALNVDGDGSSH